MGEGGGGGGVIDGFFAVFLSFQLYPILFSRPVLKYRATVVTFTSELVLASSFYVKVFM